MAVTLIGVIKRYGGTAAEMAAMDVTEIPVGSTFFQDDTGLLFGLSAAGTWTEKKTNGTMQVSGSIVKDAGKKTDADATDRTISPTGGFKHISIYNLGTAELRLCVDADSTAGEKIIYIASGQPFEDDISGAVLHYSVASGSATFTYVLR